MNCTNYFLTPFKPLLLAKQRRQNSVVRMPPFNLGCHRFHVVDLIKLSLFRVIVVVVTL